MKKFLLLFFLCLLGAAFLIFVQPKSKPLLSPLALLRQTRLTTTQSPAKEIIGFLPFWTIKEAASFRYDLLTQIIYMGVEFDDQAEVIKYQGASLQPGWSNFFSERLSAIIRQAKQTNTKILLGIQSYDADTIEAIINSPENRKKVIDQVLDLIEQKNLDGVNLDFEHAGTYHPTTSQNFTQFVKELTQAVKKKSNSRVVSLDVYADSLSRKRIYQISQLAEIVDQIIIMGYDFHRANSISAGPVAPLRSVSAASSQNLTSTLADFFQAAPAKKLILAVPYYGYEWRTASQTFGSPIYEGSGALATYKRTMDLIETQSIPVNWDAVSMTPWLTYQDGWLTKQIYFENTQSLSLKYDLVNQMDGAGIAIWALGYDGQRPELWELLAAKFKK